MRVPRIFTGDDGQSHWDEIDLNDDSIHGFTAGATWSLAERSRSQRAESAQFHRSPAHFQGKWHLVPQRQFNVFLSGETEVETADGIKRTFGAGDVLLLEDTTGQGHRGRVGSEPRLTLIVKLAPPPEASAT